MITGFNGKYRFLSNFFESPINFEGNDYNTVEHAYQAAKTTDSNLRRTIQLLRSPGEAKSAGRQLALREDWESIKLSIMLTLLRKKFRDFTLANQLLLTENEQLCEYNYWHDNFWGSCTCLRCSVIAGSNHLGKLLMQVRGELVEQQISELSTSGLH